MSSLEDVTMAILDDIREEAAKVANDGRSGHEIIYTTRPNPQTQRPYGYIFVVSEPEGGILGEDVTQLQLSAWGPQWMMYEFADSLAFIDGKKLGAFGSLRGVRYRLLPRNFTEDPDAAGVWQLSQLIEARYASTLRLEMPMS